MTEFTKGPWLATERSGYHEILASDPTCDWYGHANMHAVAYGDTEIDDREGWANAHLIAAAPELYEAVRLFLHYDSDEGENGVDMMLNYDNALTAARKAFSKAHGETQ